MKKNRLLSTLLTVFIVSTTSLVMAKTKEAPTPPKKDIAKKAKTITKKPVTNLVTKIKQLMPFIKGSHEFGKIFLDLFGLKKMGEGFDKLIDASIDFAKETERKGGVRYAKLEEHFIKMQAATELILEDIQKAVKTIVKPLQWFSPMVTGPLKLVGRKTVKRTIYGTNPKTGKKIKKTVEIPIDEVVKELPRLITNKIFKLVALYNNAVGNIMKSMKETREKIKTGIEEIKKAKKIETLPIPEKP